jgi:hypothetical protein
MGGLTMPDAQVTAEMAKQTIAKYNAKMVGAGYMSSFFKAKWVDVIDFDLLIDGIIDPVFVWN